MAKAKTIRASLVTLLLLGACSYAGSFGHLEEHSLDSAHQHSHSGAAHSHEHDSGAGHHAITSSPLLPAREQQYLPAPEHHSAGGRSPYFPVLVPGRPCEDPPRPVSVSLPDLLLFPAVPHSSLRSGRSPPSHST